MKDEKKVLSAEAATALSEGIGLVLSRWSALQLAVDNEWGGRSSRLKADQIHSDVLSWFTHSSSGTSCFPLSKILFCSSLENVYFFGT